MSLKMMKNKISIIIAFYKNHELLYNCLMGIKNLRYDNHEVIVVGNIDYDEFEYEYENSKMKWVKIDDISQGAKKNEGARIASGEFCAFIDDDAKPREDWLNKAIPFFKDPQIGAVCGPGIAFENETIMEKASSAIWASPIGSGPARYRYVSTKQMIELGEAPGYNLIVRKELLKEINGFPLGIRSGDDSIVSEKIRQKEYIIIYSPEIVVFHKRRPLFKPLLKQIYTYGVHRGYFLKTTPEISNQGDPKYIIPLLNFLFIMICTALTLVNGSFSIIFRNVLMLDLGIYFGLSLLTGLFHQGNVLVGFLCMFGIPSVHLIFSYGYVSGFFLEKLGERPSY